MAPSSLLRGAAAAPGVTTKTLQVKRFVQREPDLLLMNGRVTVSMASPRRFSLCAPRRRLRGHFAAPLPVPAADGEGLVLNELVTGRACSCDEGLDWTRQRR